MSKLTDQIKNVKEAIRLYGAQAQYFEVRGMGEWAETVRKEELKLNDELMRLFREQHATEPLTLADDPIVRKYLASRVAVADAFGAEFRAREGGA